MKKAALFLIFNRLDATKRVFEAIQKAKPSRLYIAADGAREQKRGENEKVKATREYVVANIDWDCKVKTLFRDKNLGCKIAVSRAIGWFFENEESGIILEDDCLPSQSFFWFCEELLEKYKNNKKVMHISGNQFIPNFDSSESYYFAKIEHCWGWATWADRWKYFNCDLKNYNKQNINKFSSNKNVQKYWLNILNKVKNNEIDSWAYPWTFNIIENDGFCVNPSKNLVSNIGFSKESTHTNYKNDHHANLPTYEIKNIVHPKEIAINQKAVDYIYHNVFGIVENDGIFYFGKLLRSLLK